MKIRAFVNGIEDTRHVSLRFVILNHILKVKNDSNFESCEQEKQTSEYFALSQSSNCSDKTVYRKTST